jgi:hypothetical protein
MKTTPMEYTCLKLWTRPDNYGGATWFEYYPLAGQSRDSGTRERSNFRAFHAALKAKAAELGALEVANPDFGKPADRDGYGPSGNLVCDETINAIVTVRENHWAVGWVKSGFARLV